MPIPNPPQCPAQHRLRSVPLCLLLKHPRRRHHRPRRRPFQRPHRRAPPSGARLLTRLPSRLLPLNPALRVRRWLRPHARPSHRIAQRERRHRRPRTRQRRTGSPSIRQLFLHNRVKFKVLSLLAPSLSCSPFPGVAMIFQIPSSRSTTCAA